MPLAGITKQGIRVIAFLVAVLWASIVAEHRIVNEANRQAIRTMNELRHLRNERQVQPSRGTPELPAAAPRQRLLLG